VLAGIGRLVVVVVPPPCVVVGRAASEVGGPAVVVATLVDWVPRVVARFDEQAINMVRTPTSGWLGQPSG